MYQVRVMGLAPMSRGMIMGGSRLKQGSTFGGELDLLLTALFKAKAPYEERKRELLSLEKRWTRQAKTPAQRLSVQRIVAKTLLTEAFGFDMPWKEFGRWLRRLRQLGFRELSARVHVACLYVQSLHLFPRQARDAWAMLEDTERRARRLRRDRPLRQEHLESIAHARLNCLVVTPATGARSAGVVSST